MPENISLSDALARQPEALASAVRTLRDQLGEGAWPAPRRPLFTAMGASHAALAAPVHRLREHGVAAGRAGYGELPGTGPVDGDLVIGASQSGRSSETVAALQRVEPARRLAVLNVVDSPLGSLAGDGGQVLGCAGVPDSKVSTGGFTVTLAGLGMLADTWTAGRPGDGWASLPDLLAATSEKAEEALAPLIEAVAGSVAVDVAGGGASLTAAEEGALMLREACRLPATPFETRQYLHGPMEGAGRTAHVLIGDGREARIAEQLTGAGHTACYVGPARTTAPHVPVEPLAAVPRAILETAVLQRLVAAVAAARSVPVGEFRFSVDDTKVDAVPAAVPAEAV